MPPSSPPPSLPPSAPPPPSPPPPSLSPPTPTRGAVLAAFEPFRPSTANRAPVLFAPRSAPSLLFAAAALVTLSCGVARCATSSRKKSCLCRTDMSSCGESARPLRVPMPFPPAPVPHMGAESSADKSLEPPLLVVAATTAASAAATTASALASAATASSPSPSPPSRLCASILLLAAPTSARATILQNSADFICATLLVNVASPSMPHTRVVPDSSMASTSDESEDQHIERTRLEQLLGSATLRRLRTSTGSPCCFVIATFHTTSPPETVPRASNCPFGEKAKLPHIRLAPPASVRVESASGVSEIGLVRQNAASACKYASLKTSPVRGGSGISSNLTCVTAAASSSSLSSSSCRSPLRLGRAGFQRLTTLR
eukprot:1151867-Pleurochrysis_carterae.AAC.1